MWCCDISSFYPPYLQLEKACFFVDFVGNKIQVKVISSATFILKERISDAVGNLIFHWIMKKKPNCDQSSWLLFSHSYTKLTGRVPPYSVFICVGQQSVGNTIIHTATRGHWSTGNKHESHWAKTNDGVVLWRRLEMANHQSCFIWFKCPYEFIFSHASAYKADDRRGLMSPYSSELYITDTRSKGYIWISLLHHNTSHDCVLHIAFLSKQEHV